LVTLPPTDGPALSSYIDNVGPCVFEHGFATGNLTSGAGKVDEIHEVRFRDKVRAIEHLAKHFGLLVERIEHTRSVDLRRLQAARRRGRPVADVLVEATPVEQ
jgi:hypothetical protein